MTRARTLTGAAVVCLVNGQVYGQVVGFSWRSMTARKALYGLDAVDPQELAPTQAKIVGTLRLLRTIDDGGAEGGGMAAFSEDLARERYFSVQLIDRGADRVLFQADYCSLVSQSWEIQPKTHVSGTLEFEALAWANSVKNK